MSQPNAEALLRRILIDLSQPTPVGRELNPRLIADIAAQLYGDNDEDVKATRGITGPVAESLAYIEKSTGDFLIILPDSRNYTPSPYNIHATYTAAILDKPGDHNTARCVSVHTGYLKNGCEPIDLNDVPLQTQAALFNILSRKDEPGTWDKIYVGGTLSPDIESQPA